uniref:F-actin monooxygenase n=1 Tax=Cyprinus carpio TaxID=7962 RepID=A0A8C2INI6_CYPCA
MGDGGVNAVGEGVNQSHVLFDRFVQATTCKGTLKAFQELCDFLELKPNEYCVFYHKLKSKLNYWKAKALWAKLDKRASHKEYKKGRACANTKCLIIGAGPCGLRTAIELGFLGAKVVLLEKRDAFSRNNVLHLWPFTIHDLRGLGAKKFYGKFCAGAIDHISIRQLQLMLLKVALLLGIEIHVNVEFKDMNDISNHAAIYLSLHVSICLSVCLSIILMNIYSVSSGFKRKEFRGKLAIAITANFINRNTTAEAKVEEISGVAFIFNQKFFQDLREATGIDLENIVYYKDDTHYFVMTAKKQSLLEKGVILHDYADTEMLLSRANVDQKALLSYAIEAADFSTNHQLPKLDFAINHYGQPDVAMFDFTCMYASENAALVRQRNAHKLLVALVGDSLLEPFWPMGTGIARGFLAGLDAAWMVRSWAHGSSPLEVLAERESIYRLLPQTTPENVSKNFSQYSVDPTTRYPNISLHQVRPNQVRHLLDTGEIRDLRVDMENVVNSSTPKLTRNESIVRSSKLLNWCQRQTEGYRGVSVSDLTTCWKSGLALCALIHCYRPDLIDFDSLDEKDVEKNNQLAFDVAEKEFGISPIMTGKEMSVVVEPDKLSMVMYLSQFYEMFKDTVPPGENHNLSPEEKAALIASTKSPISFFSKLGQSIAISRKRNPKDKKEKELDGLGKRRKTSQAGQSEDEELKRVNRDDRPSIATALAERKIDSAAAVNNNNKVKVMATQLLAKFEENAPTQSTGLKRQGSLRKEFPQNIGGSDVCFFCRKRVYVMERLSAEGKFFHRSCFKCDYCGTTLRLSSYAFDVEDGKFYCKPHYCYRLSGLAQRKRPAAPVLAVTPNTVDAPGQSITSQAPVELRPSEVNGVTESSVAKRLKGTPERIELENYRLSMMREEELQEVPEETLAEHNLSSVLDKATDIEEGSRYLSHLYIMLVKDVSPVMLVKSPGARFFSEPYLLDDVKPNIPLPQSPDAKSPYSPAAQIIALSPICSQPVPQPETTSLKSPVQHEPCACSPTGNPLSPICTQSQPCNEPPSPLSTSSPVRTQPVPAITSTPLAKPASEKRTNDPLKDSVPEESPIKKTDIIEEFWLKSAEIRKSLGLSPLDRSKPSVEKSIVKTPTPGSPSPKSYTPEDLSEEQKPSFTGRSIIRRINITLEGQVISPVEPKSNGSEKKDLSSSSGLGLNGSVTTSQTVASDSYNNSDSTMLTPPSSPPPLPPNEEPASLQTKRSQTPVSPPQPKPVVAPVQDPGTNPPVVMRVKEPNKPRREEVRKSFVECIDEIPFADDVEDTYDDRTPDTSVLEKFYTPPTSKVNREKPPLHLALAMENGKPNIPSGVSRTAKGPQRFSLEAKEIAEERMRAREKSVKSQALKDAMSKQLTKMKESDAAKGAVAKVAWNVPETTGKNKKQSNTPKDSAVKALESKKQTETLPDRFFTTPTSKTLDSSVTSSESSTGGKSKKRSSLFSPRKNKKEKKAKNERLSGTEETPPKHKSLWKTVFSGYKKDKKKKDDKSCPSTSSSSTTEDSGKKKESPLDRSSDLRLRRNLSFSEDSDLSCDDVLERSSQKSKGDKTYTEEELNAKLTRRVQKAARRQAKQEELKRLHRAQIIQRQLEQVEEKQRQLEERGVAVEKALRGEAGMGKKDDPKLMQEWFKLVQEKNALVRYESELMIFARELELEDRQSRLQQELRERMAVDDHLKTEEELAEEKQILNEMLEVVEQRDSLVALLEEQRLREKEEDKDLEAVMLSKGFSLDWA